MQPQNELINTMTRRHFFGKTATGIGAAALASLLNPSKTAAGVEPSPSVLHFAPRAKRVLYIFQAGGPAQMELWDHKPRLAEWHGQDLPASVRGDQRLTGFVSGQGKLPIIASPFKFKRHGQSGQWASELVPYQAKIVDDLCFIKSMNTEAVNHDPAATYLLTGAQQAGRPSIGSWLSYGIGSENADLPAFVVLVTTGLIPDAATPLAARLWGSGFLPSQHQGVKFRSGSNAVLHVSNPPGIDKETRRRMIDVGAQLNQLQYESFGDPEIATRIAQYEMAYRMQTSVPGLMDLSGESQSTFDRYGPLSRQPGTYAASCILARRLIESGVRFVQLFDRDWDHHRSEPIHMRTKTQMTDQPTAALIQDLKMRGLLDETLVICGGEFGRSVYSQGPLQENYGRDHHGRCFTMWAAGGGVRGGLSYGVSDDHCYNVARDPVHIHDLNATILHQLGIDHEQLTFKFQGRHFRLTDVEGHVVKGMLG